MSVHLPVQGDRVVAGVGRIVVGRAGSLDQRCVQGVVQAGDAGDGDGLGVEEDFAARDGGAGIVPVVVMVRIFVGPGGIQREGGRVEGSARRVRAQGVIDADVEVLLRQGQRAALPAVEIQPLSGVYSFEAKYNAGETRFYTPARLSEEVSEHASTAALLAHRTLGLRHISRIDLIVDAAGVAWFLEANVLPGLTETSLLPLALEAAGHDIGWVYSALAEAAIMDSRS